MLKKSLLMILPVLLLAACGGGAAQSQTSTEIVLDASEFAYSPITVTIPAGVPVELTLKNVGAVEHDFVIDKIDAQTEMMHDSGSDAHHVQGEAGKYDLHFSAQPGETSTIQFTVTEPGTYTFYCSVAGHKEAGMLGELIVRAEN